MTRSNFKNARALNDIMIATLKRAYGKTQGSTLSPAIRGKGNLVKTLSNSQDEENLDATLSIASTQQPALLSPEELLP